MLEFSQRRSQSLQFVTFVVLLVPFCIAVTPCFANPTLLVQTGDVADGGALFASFTKPVINNNGKVAYLGALQHGVASVDASNDSGLWSFDNQQVATEVREGVGGVPEIAGAQFDELQSFSLSDADEIVLQARLRMGLGGITSSNRDGIWKLGTGSSLLVQTGSTVPPGVSGASFVAIGAPLFAGGAVATPSQMQVGPAVSHLNDRGIWSYGSPSGSALLVREGSTIAPGAPGSMFIAFGPQSVNEQGVVSTTSVLDLNGSGVTTTNRFGLWTHGPSGGSLIARQELSTVAGAAGAKFESFDDSSINFAGAVSFKATLRHDGSVTASNDRGLWHFDGTDTDLMARENDTSVPGISGARFLDFGSPQLTNPGQMYFQADLINGMGGVTTSDDQGIWSLDTSSGLGELIARIGSGEVPGLPGANFASFTSWTPNDSGQVALAAELEVGAGGVTAGSSEGIWLLDPTGTSTLIVQTGESIAGKTITSLGISDGKTVGLRALNDRGDLVFQADFADGGSGLFLYEAPDDFSPADFNESGSVDDGDLALWLANFGTFTGLPGDADGDDAVQGLDLLLWQREFDGGMGQASAVPEPRTLLLAALCFAFTTLRDRKYKR